MAAELLRHPKLAVICPRSNSNSPRNSPLQSPRLRSSVVPLALPGDRSFRRFSGLRPLSAITRSGSRSNLSREETPKGRKGRSLVRAAIAGGTRRGGSRERDEVRQKEAVIEQEYTLTRRTTLSSKVSVRVAGIPGKRALLVSISSDILAPLTIHWGVTPRGDQSKYWEQPPPSMHPPGSKLVKDYAVETPMTCQVLKAPPGQGNSDCQVDIEIPEEDAPAAINFVLRDEQTGQWFQDSNKNFHIPLPEPLPKQIEAVETHLEKGNRSPLRGLFSTFSNIFSPIPPNTPPETGADVSDTPEQEVMPQNHWNKDGAIWLERDHVLVREVAIKQKVKVRSMSDSNGVTSMTITTDMPGPMLLHWGVIPEGGDTTKWCLPDEKYRPENTTVYKNKAVQTPLLEQPHGLGSEISLQLGPELQSLHFVLKDVTDNKWYDNEGGDFVVLTPSGQIAAAAEKAANVELLERLVILPSSPGHAHSQKQHEEERMLLELHRKEAEAAAEAAKAAAQSASANAELQSRLKDLEKLAQQQKAHEEELRKKQEEDEKQVLASPPTAAVKAPVAEPPKEAPRITPPPAPQAVATEIPPRVDRQQVLKEIEEIKAVVTQNGVQTTPQKAPETTPPVPWRPLEGRPCSGTGSGMEILLQGFNWESCRAGNWYNVLANQAKEIAEMGFTVVWLPPPTDSVAPEGYMPRDLYNLNSKYGDVSALKNCIAKLHEVGVKVLGDAVLNHRCAHFQDNNGIWNRFGGKLAWDNRAIVSDDPHFHGAGHRSSGDNFHGAPNIDHSQDFVRRDLTEWMRWLRTEVGYDGWRLDYVRGFWGGYVKDYLEGTQPEFAVGEYWDSLNYTYGEMDYNQDAHRQRIIDWINATGGSAGAFDVTTKGVLHSALERCEYWRLKDAQGKPPGVVGWWPSRAVTFIENHDTGSTQGHWRFPRDKEMQGYAYILTHPGTPTVFYDHLQSHHRHGIKQLLAVRKHAGLHCRSVVKIEKAEKDVYGACIDDKVCVKIGPGHFQPSGKKNWKISAEGPDYKVWEIAS